MKLVLFICLVVVCYVAAEKELSDKRYPYPYCVGVDCNNCYFSVDDCYYCCRGYPLDCRFVNCLTCDIKYCGHCCGIRGTD